MIMLSYPILTVYVYEYFFNHSSLHFLTPPSHLLTVELFPPSLICTLSTLFLTVLSLSTISQMYSLNSSYRCTLSHPFSLHSLTSSRTVLSLPLSPSLTVLSLPSLSLYSLSPSLSVPSPPLSHCTFCLRFWYVCWQSVNRNPSKPNQTFFDRSRRILVIAERYIQGRTFEMFTIQ